MDIMKIFRRRPKQINVTGNLDGKLSIGGPFNRMLDRHEPLHLEVELNEGVMQLLRDLSEKNIKRTYLVPCRGAEVNPESFEVTALVTIGETYLRVRCPRLHEDLDYYVPGTDEAIKQTGTFCYCGELQKIPIVHKDTMANFGIFPCSYIGHH